MHVAVVATAKEEEDEEEEEKEAEEEEEEAALAQPRIITHTDDGGSRMKGKEDVNKLPYMNRNPAV